MAKNLTVSTVQRTAMGNGGVANYNSGYLGIYDGTQPAGPDTAVTSQNLLATLRLNATGIASVTAGVLTAGAIVSDTNATGGAGAATWFRILKSDNSTAVVDGTVGTSGTNCVIASTTIGAGATVSCSSLVFTVAAASAL